ncbi:MAG: NAD(P)/FAD-dependent oxidoreductase [Clostridium sp.]|nr:MAG: NAD(P)/FAD-dependent oxidoreductase [Clostridium sp.]
MSNLNMNEDFYNHKDFIKRLYSSIPKEKVYDFFDRLGILTKADNEGRIYPYSNSSQTVLDALLNKMQKNVHFNYNYLVKNIKYTNKWYINDFNLGFDHLFITSGSIAGIDKQKAEWSIFLFEFFEIYKAISLIMWIKA